MKSPVGNLLLFMAGVGCSIASCALGEPNRLIHEQSPYLQQHADNPVDWYPWGEEAFARARAENKIVFVSIGYSTCHWCHVMNRESFSNPETAAYLNEHFICIKVDREERPDVDHACMSFVQQITGVGGWPLNVWLTPEGKPFYGGTYFPPDRSRGGRGATFLEVLARLKEVWETERQDVLAKSDSMANALNEWMQNQNSGTEGDLGFETLGNAIVGFERIYNANSKAFGSGPNFPSAANLSFLLRCSRLKELDASLRSMAETMALDSLKAMATGGIRDHIGGGFHRYTVDAQWKLPHFEKMLYDQAGLINAYLDAWLIAKDPLYSRAAQDSLEYLLRDLRHEGGAFCSAEDAESYPSLDAKAKREGAFYVWSLQALREALPEEDLFELARRYFAVESEGNAPFSSEALSGYSILRIEKSTEQIAVEMEVSELEIQARLQRIYSLLREARSLRPRPALDDKVITAWNGMAISAFARAAQVFGERRYAIAAAEAAAFLRETLYDAASGKLKRLYRNDPSPIAAFSEDYAFLIQGLIDLYEASAEPQWLEWANALQATQSELFYDAARGGFFSYPTDPLIELASSKAFFDGELPSANSTSAKNLARLSQLFDDADYERQARQTIASALPAESGMLIRLPSLLEAALYVVKKPIQIVIASPSQDGSLAAVANSILLPNRLLLHADGGSSQAFLSKHLEFIRTAVPMEGESTAYVCENFVCQLPARSPEELLRQLEALVE